MLEIDGNNIYLTRGDYAEIEIAIYLEDTFDEHGEPVPYEPVEGDTIGFRMKRDILVPSEGEFIDSTASLSKAIPIDTMTLTILPADTEKLRFGEYRYQMELIHNSMPFTFLEGIFEVGDEV